MVEVTEADFMAAEAALPALLASIKGEEGGFSLAQAFATHRIAAAKAERDRLDNIPVNWELTWGPVYANIRAVKCQAIARSIRALIGEMK